MARERRAGKLARSTIRALAVAAALGAAGCGGDGGGDDDLASRIDEVCLDEARAFDQLSGMRPRGAAEVADQIERSLAVREDALADLRALDPPEESEEPFAAYVANREESLDVMDAAARAARRDDRETLGVALSRLSDLTSDRTLIAAQLGADECATSADGE